MQYSSEQLKEITAIIEKGGKFNDIAKFLNVCVKTVRRNSKAHSELKKAILMGRKAKYYLQYEIVKANLAKIEEVAEKTGRRSLVAEFLKIDLSKLQRTERIYPFLSVVIQKGLKRYEENKQEDSQYSGVKNNEQRKTDTQTTKES